MSSLGNVWAANRIQHICNTVIHRFPISGLFRIHKRSQRDNSNEYHKRANFPENIEFSGISLVRVEFDRELQC